MDNFTGFFKDTEILQKAAFNKKFLQRVPC